VEILKHFSKESRCSPSEGELDKDPFSIFYKLWCWGD